METTVLHFSETTRMTDEEFFLFCQDNPELKIERTKQGNIILMALTGGETSTQNSEVNAEFVLWNRQTRFGKVFDSSGGFRLSDTSILSPDVAIVAQARWEALSLEQRKKFPPICPDFVLELKSPSDRLRDAQAKLQDWLDNGCRLAWLLDSETQIAYVYRPGQPVEEKRGFAGQLLSGEAVLPGFTLALDLLR